VTSSDRERGGAAGLREEDLPELVNVALAKRLSSARPLDYDSLYKAVHGAWNGARPASGVSQAASGVWWPGAAR
jgi:hypothetical protein